MKQYPISYVYPTSARVVFSSAQVRPVFPVSRETSRSRSLGNETSRLKKPRKWKDTLVREYKHSNITQYRSDFATATETKTMDENEAITGLKQLGLTTYEARVFVALQKLGGGTASEISSVVEVPRSQVYGAAEGLEERGLVETQQSTPTAYRPVPLEQARRLLLDQLAATGAETFNYLEQVQNSHETEERSESIWLISAREAIISRTVEIIEMADSRLLYGAENVDMLEDTILDALVDATDRGVEVVITSSNDEVIEAVPDTDAYTTYRVPEERDMDVSTGRLLVADGHTVLLSTRSATTEDDHQEIAFWTSDNPFAAIFVELVEAWLRDPYRS